MKLILFDLGDTLEHQDQLLPGALATLQALQAMKDPDGQPLILGLVSDFLMPQNDSEVPAIRAQYVAILEQLGIKGFFLPADKRVTLSTDVGVFKPDPLIFRRALDKNGTGLGFADALFVTEKKSHVLAVRQLGMHAVHFKGPGQASGDIGKLADLVPHVQAILDDLA